jgi:hypothetical protein
MARIHGLGLGFTAVLERRIRVTFCLSVTKFMHLFQQVLIIVLYRQFYRACISAGVLCRFFTRSQFLSVPKMSDDRQNKIENALQGAVIATDVCGSVENLGQVVAKYQHEVDEERVVHVMFTSFFHKYKSLRATSKELREKLEAERGSHATSVRKFKDQISVLENKMGEMRLKYSTESARMRATIKRLEEADKARKLLDSGIPDGKGGRWLSVSRPTTSTQVTGKQKKLTKKRCHQEVHDVPETSDEEDDGNDVVPAQMFYRDTCEMSEIPKY